MSSQAARDAMGIDPLRSNTVGTLIPNSPGKVSTASRVMDRRQASAGEAPEELEHHRSMHRTRHVADHNSHPDAKQMLVASGWSRHVRSPGQPKKGGPAHHDGTVSAS